MKNTKCSPVQELSIDFAYFFSTTERKNLIKVKTINPEILKHDSFNQIFNASFQQKLKDRKHKMLVSRRAFDWCEPFLLLQIEKF